MTARQYAAPKQLGVTVFTAPGKAVVSEQLRPFGEPVGWDPITSTLKYGEYDAVLVDTLATVAEAEALEDWVALHVPSIDLVVGGDVLYGQCHMYVGDTTLESRRNWIRGARPAGASAPEDRRRRTHETGAPDLPSAIQDSKCYLEDLDRLHQSIATDEEQFNEMTKRYPAWESSQSWLMFCFPSFPEPTED